MDEGSWWKFSSVSSNSNKNSDDDNDFDVDVDEDDESESELDPESLECFLRNAFDIAFVFVCFI